MYVHLIFSFLFSVQIALPLRNNVRINHTGEQRFSCKLIGLLRGDYPSIKEHPG